LSSQKTICRPVSVSGRGLFTGKPCTLRFLPASVDAGVSFVLGGMDGPVTIPLDISKVVQRDHRTSLVNGAGAVETIEHVLAAVRGAGVDNLVIEMDAAETPSIDGSSLPFWEAIQKAGLQDQQAPRNVYVIEEPVSVSDGDAMLAALPGPADGLDIIYDLDYSDIPSIGRQTFSFRLGQDDFAAQLAPARTFTLEREARELQAAGQCTHLSLRDVLVMGDQGPLDNTLRFPDEHVRHKICDLIGDLSLLGRGLRGRIVAYKSGHALNHELVRKLLDQIEAREQARRQTAEPLMDVRRVMRLLPHRYPFLMVDRILSLEGDKRAVGIKNVSINEPFFQGHWPGQPVMPGVMILEALAQISGILLAQRLEHTGKIAVLLSMDRVKMRRLVRPGDQLILEAEALHVRPRTGHCRCIARVGKEVAVEAEIKFMLVDSEPM
jgi:UDP-3-O-[3-hydroxymyristoyl] N-acetylglucosamine deacetylase/3-hydroxyacyl-[acyl-carrier-protein] dehydratase